MSSAEQIAEVCDSIKELLLSKNAKYGDSALNPTRVMSKANAVEQILVRIDDKLSRISSGAGLLANDEDVIEDIIGYFVLLKIALKRQQEEETQLCLDAYKDAAVEGYDKVDINQYSSLTFQEAVEKDWEDFWHNEDTVCAAQPVDMNGAIGVDSIYLGGDVVPNVRETPIGIEIGGPTTPVKNDVMWDEDDAYMWDPTLGPTEPAEPTPPSNVIHLKDRNLYDSPWY